MRPSTRSLRRYLAILSERRLSALFRSRGERLSIRPAATASSDSISAAASSSDLVALRSLEREHRRHDRRVDRRRRGEARRIARAAARGHVVEAGFAGRFSPLRNLDLTSAASAPSRCSPSAERSVAQRSVHLSATKRGAADYAHASTRTASSLTPGGCIALRTITRATTSGRSRSTASATPRVLAAHVRLARNGFNVEAYAAGSISGVASREDRTTEVRVSFAPRVAKAAVAAAISSPTAKSRSVRRRMPQRSSTASPTSTSSSAGCSAGARRQKSSHPSPCPRPHCRRWPKRLPTKYAQ